MSSSVFYRFKSQKEPSRVAFDGTGISVFELKREIIAQSKLGDGTDFELTISAEDSSEAYDDDTSIIPRSTAVIARRLPATRPGRGGAARYVSGKMPQNAKNALRHETSAQRMNHGPSNGTIAMNVAQSEDDRIAAMLQMGADDWAQQSQHLASVAPVHRQGPVKSKPHGEVNRPIPQGYVCNRCGEKGHWIWDCPTNNDPNYDNRPRIKRTTGIPKSFLKTIEKPIATVIDGATEDKKQPTGVMVNAEGDWVVAEPDQAAWDRYQAQTKSSTAAQDAVGNGAQEIRDLGLECPIDNRLFLDPTKTPCCGTTYCRECIQNALLDNDLRCPNCQSENVPIDDLTPNEDALTKTRQYQHDKVQEQERDSTQEVTERASPSRSDRRGEIDSSKQPDSSDITTFDRPLSPLEPNKGARKRAAGSELETNRKQKSPRPPTGPSAELDRPQRGSKAAQNTLTEPSITPNPNLINPNPLNQFMNFGMPFNAGIQNPMMMTPVPFMAPGWNNNNAWAMGQNNPYMFAGGQQQMGFNNNANMMQTPVGQSGGFQSTSTRFANQQRSHNEEESAYFRKPVNPQRQNNRKNWNQSRPADYREI